MTYNQLYYRLCLLNTARTLPGLGARALVEIIALRAASAPAVADFEATRQSIAADTTADPDTRDRAIAVAAEAECTAPWRGLSPEAFAQLAEAAVAADGQALILPGIESPVSAADWLEAAYACLTQEGGAA
ncbi:MAG: hypothetical protein K2J38_02135 [Muribaculaceae bacterium]|nr:hypothetical protein [Muribaculaceae bacterium]